MAVKPKLPPGVFQVTLRINTRTLGNHLFELQKAGKPGQRNTDALGATLGAHFLLPMRPPGFDEKIVLGRYGIQIVYVSDRGDGTDG